MGLTSLIQGFEALGLEPPSKAFSDVSLVDIRAKITNPSIARQMGAKNSLMAIEQAEWCANLMDSKSESGDDSYLLLAEEKYQALLRSLSAKAHSLVTTAAAAAFNYFAYEQLMARRIAHGDRFVEAEMFEYLLRRGSDAVIYALLLQELDGINDPGLVTGFRVRQGLWDLADDIVDVEQDSRSIGANILLLASLKRQKIRAIADSLFTQSREVLNDKHPLFRAIEKEYDRVVALLAA